MKFQKTNNLGRIYVVSLVAVLGGFLFGYDTAVISGTVGSLEAYFIDPYNLADKAANLVLGFIVSSALIGCVLGSAMGGLVSQKLGRKKGLQLSALLFLLSALGSAYPEIGFALPPDTPEENIRVFIETTRNFR